MRRPAVFFSSGRVHGTPSGRVSNSRERSRKRKFASVKDCHSNSVCLSLEGGVRPPPQFSCNRVCVCVLASFRPSWRPSRAQIGETSCVCFSHLSVEYKQRDSHNLRSPLPLWSTEQRSQPFCSASGSTHTFFPGHLKSLPTALLILHGLSIVPRLLRRFRL